MKGPCRSPAEEMGCQSSSFHDNLPRFNEGRSILADTNLQAQSVRALDDCLDNGFLDLSVMEIDPNSISNFKLAVLVRFLFGWHGRELYRRCRGTDRNIRSHVPLGYTFVER
jgi:hypothetical protein